MSSACSRCGKPVYFAERKTSLGKDWHPNCLRCQECGKVLTPGQHAEHKGVPYCHKPCYSSLFGPQILGYGSNVSSSANFRKSSEVEKNTSQTQSNDGETTFFFTGAELSPGHGKDKKDSSKSRQLLKNGSNSSINTQSTSSGYQSHSGNSSLSGSSTALDAVSESGNDGGLKLVYQSSPDSRKSSGSLETQTKKSTNVLRSNSDVGKFTSVPDRQASRLRGVELFKKVQSYNEHHKTKRGQTLSLTEEEGNVRVQGPLRIYWGLKKPIMLKQYDEIPSRDTPKKRYSVITDTRDLKPLPEIQNDTEVSSPVKRTFTDDSVLSSPVTEVVMRRTNIKKSNTVAYRGDKPNRWKRASINGHIYNYDTSVFTPVLGSCTCVTVDNKMTVQQVIKALLEKFKVENQPDEYNLCIVSEHEEERVLRDADIPLLERLVHGPSDTVKLFIRDQPDMVPIVMATNIPDDSSPTTELPVGETPLPEEVEQLMTIPEPVLRGLLEKFKADEDKEIRRLKGKYDRIRKRVQQIIDDKKANISRC